MKKLLLSILTCYIFLNMSAQVPTQINYQGIARNSVGNVLPNQAVTVRLSVHDGSATGTVVYSETRSVTTNAFGLFFYGIGSPGASPVTGTLAGINWSTGNKYLQVEIDPKGGTNFIDAGTSQLLSVPYAIYAAAASPTGAAGGSLMGTYPNPTVANGAITLTMIAPGVIPTTLPPSGPAGGSLSGTYPNPLIANGAVQQAMIAPGVTLPPSGPAGGSLTGTYPNPLVANGAITQAMLSPGISLPPTGAAGGSLTGNYPNPTIATGAVTALMIAPGVIPTTLPPSGAAGGDLTGTYPNPTVSKLLGRSINNTVPVLNDVLGFDGTDWGPVSLPAASSNFWTASGNNIYNNNTGRVGIGTSSPTKKLDVVGGINSTDDNGAAFVGSSTTGYGVYATSGHIGVYGDGDTYGVYGTSSTKGVRGFSNNGWGVVGESNTGYGVYANGATGVRAEGGTYGVLASSFNNIGVHGSGGQIGISGAGASSGVSGYSTNGYGVKGETPNGTGVYGHSDNGRGVEGIGATYGVRGAAIDNGIGVEGYSYGGYGVNGYSVFQRGGNFYSSNQYGLWAKTGRNDASWAGVFEGVVYTYNFYQTSDESLKKNIEEVDGAMNVLMQLKPKKYQFRNDGKLANLGLPTGKHYGILAQDLEKILPNLVKEVENEVSPYPAMDTIMSRTNAQRETIKIKAVNYTELIPIVIKGMQEQQAIIESQKNKIETLEERIAKLEALISTITKK